MRRKPKTEIDPPEPYRHYRVPAATDDATVPAATADDTTADDTTADDTTADDTTADDTNNTCVVVVMIGLSIVSIGFYVAIFAVVALVLANMLGLIDWPFG